MSRYTTLSHKYQCIYALVSCFGWNISFWMESSKVKLNPDKTDLIIIGTKLRSSISQQLIMPKTKLNLDKRAFSVAVPWIWNALPITLKT